jgi:hypothetical protein
LRSRALAQIRGLTLIEMMIYMTLVTLILGSSMIIMMMANRFFHSTLDNNAVQREAQTAMLKISRELEEGKRGKVVLSASGEPKGVIFLSARTNDGDFAYDYTGDGLLFWQKWVCFYVDEDAKSHTKLYRAESALGTPETDPPDTVLTTSDFQALGNPQVVAHDLISFDIQADTTSANTFNISASFGREGQTNRTDGDRMAEKVDVENSVHLRN